MPRSLLLLPLALALLVGCSSAPAASPAPTLDLTPQGDPARLAEGSAYRTLGADWDEAGLAALVAAARAEGSVRWDGYNQDQIDAWCAAFTARFSIDCSGRALASFQAVSTLTAEAEAGRAKTDVAYLSMSQMAAYLDAGLAAPVDWAALGASARRAWDAGGVGNAIGVAQSQYTHFANTRDVDPAGLPRTLADWLDPRWKGLICAPDFLLRAGNGFLALYYDPQVMIEFHRRLLDEQDVVVTSDCDALTVSGERPLQYLGYGYPQALLGTGFIEPFWNPGMGVNLFSHAVAAGAPHPNAARLFAAWSTSREASALSWEAIGQGWAAFGHGPEGLTSGRFAELDLVYESPATFRERSAATRTFQDALFPGS
jgi:ABC-type Fe3+ transport system substrate-binding protein